MITLLLLTLACTACSSAAAARAGAAAGSSSSVHVALMQNHGHASGNSTTIESFGVYYLVQLNGLASYSVEVMSNGSEIKRFEPQGVNTNVTLREHRTTVPVLSRLLRNHAYIATGTNVLILNTVADNSTFVRLLIGHKPIQIGAFEVANRTYVLACYENNERRYVATYQHLGGSAWVQYGLNHLLLTSPEWYDVSHLSNVVMFVAADEVSGDAIFTAVAENWNVHIYNMMDGRYTGIEAPEPCDTITHLSFSRINQAIIVSCVELTLYYDLANDQFYTNAPLASLLGPVTLSQDGRFGGIEQSINESVSMLTVLDFRSKPVGSTPFNFFQVAVHLETEAIGQYVTVNNNRHYYCYVEAVLGYRVSCFHLEHALQNKTSPKLAVTRLEGSHTQCMGGIKIHAQDGLLGVNVRKCNVSGDGNSSLLMIYNMTTLANIWNVTGLKWEGLIPVWAKYNTPIVLQQHNLDTSPSLPSPATNTLLPSPKSTSSAVMAIIQHSLSLTPSLPALSPTLSFLALSPSSSSPALSPTPSSSLPTLSPTPPFPALSPSPSLPALSNGGMQDFTCSSQLEAARQSYQHLFWVTIAMAGCFSLAMVFTIAMVVGLICVSRLSRSHRGGNQEAGDDSQGSGTKKPL